MFIGQDLHGQKAEKEKTPEILDVALRQQRSVVAC